MAMAPEQTTNSMSMIRRSISRSLQRLYTLDANGQPHFIGTRLDGRTTEQIYDYDDNLRLIQMGFLDYSFYSLNGETLQTWSDDGHNLLTLTDPLGSETFYHYDNDTTDPAQRYNNLTKMIDDQSNETTYEYEHPDFPTLVTAMVDAEHNRTVYTYTADGYLEQEVEYLQGTAQQATTFYVYDGLGQRIRDDQGTMCHSQA